MTETSISLLPFYKGWETYQDRLIKAIEPLSREQLTLEIAPDLRSAGQNAAHIVGTRAGWLYFVLELRDERLLPLAEWNAPGQPARSAADLIQGLETTWQVIQKTLTQWTIADLSELVYDTDDNGEKHTYTRQWVIWHLIEHDLHHGGELSFTLGAHGLPGISI